MPHQQRIAELRAAASEGISRVDQLRARSFDPDCHKLLQVTRHWYEDIENFFLYNLETGDLSARDQQMYLDGAKIMLNIAEQHLSTLPLVYEC